MNEPYENQLIGAFLFGLGQEIGRLDTKQVSADFGVNLFQQTPLDTSYGDLVVGSTCCFLIELKRTKAQLAAERAKWSADALTKLSASADFVRISRVGHVVVYGRASGNQVDLRGCTYPDVLGIGEQPDCDRYDACRIVTNLAHAHLGTRPMAGLTAQSMAQYLSVLRSIRRRGESKGSSDAETWLGVARRANGLSLCTASSLDHLMDRFPARRHHVEHVREADRDHGMGF